MLKLGMTDDEIRDFLKKKFDAYSLDADTKASIKSKTDISINELLISIHTLTELLPELIVSIVEENNRILSKQISEILSKEK